MIKYRQVGGEGGGEKERETFLIHHTGNGSKDPMKWNFNMVLICISFMARMLSLSSCFLAIWTSSF
jgi:hypothetical protein